MGQQDRGESGVFSTTKGFPERADRAQYLFYSLENCNVVIFRHEVPFLTIIH